MSTDWKRHIIPVLASLGRRAPALEAELNELSDKAREELFRVLKHAEEEVISARRKAKDAQRGIFRR